MTRSRTASVFYQPICCQLKSPSHLRRAFSMTLSPGQVAEESKLPRVATPSLWASIIPRSWRRSSKPRDKLADDPAAAAERRAGVAFFVLGILVGSNAIQILTLRREALNFSRDTEAKLAVLRETIDKVKNGVDVDVKRALGTGNSAREMEWESVIDEVENTDMLLEGKRKKQEQRLAREDVAQDKEQETQKDENATSGRPRQKFLM